MFDSEVAAVASTRDVIVATGPDAAAYLHGQLSQDVHGLEIGSSAMTLLLQPQGKVDAWMRLSRIGPATFWLDVERGFGSVALERLQRFKLRVDCELTLSTQDITALRGPETGNGIAGLGLEIPPGTVVLDALWPGVDGFDVFAPIGPWLGDKVARASLDALDALRIRLGIPAMGSELDESTIPAAAGIVEASVDFTKGCYVGQELVARIDSRGNNTPTRLCGVVSTDARALAVGSPVIVDEATVGTLTSVATTSVEGSTVGLMFLKRAVALPSAASATDVDGSPAAVDLVELPVA